MSGNRDDRARRRSPYPISGWDLGRLRLHAPARPLVMGILNVTPDSFYPGSRRPEPDAAVDQALAMIAAGAELLDMGAESTRPGAEPVPDAQEQDRLLPVLEGLRGQTDVPLSVDTRRASTAGLAIEAGADVINDIGAGRDPGMLPLLGRSRAGVVLMHMQGEPDSMQRDPRYDDPVAEVRDWLEDRVTAAVAAGVDENRVLVDPGLGFGKLLPHNLALLADLRRVAAGRRLLVGASRKSFVGAITGAGVDDRLPGSLAALAAAHAAGAMVVRVHDVAASVQFLDVLAAIAEAGDDEADESVVEQPPGP
ncbi:dihydropteroate synthase [bacterium]|nr:dihydropteroate synthase [bacterium]